MAKKNYHGAQYGNVVLHRGYCNNCNSYAFIKNKEFQCCDSPADVEGIQKKKMMTSAVRKRKQPSQGFKELLLKLQKNKCAYCGTKFGDIIWFRGRVTAVAPFYDHIEPFIYSYNNHTTNYVAACRICNGLKSDRLFNSVREVLEYVRKRREKRGYKTAEEIELLELWSNLQSEKELAKILF